jgi:type I restriction enzyme S subunit
MSNLLPDDWNLKICAELCHVITKGTTPSSVGFSFQENGINFIKVESINSNGVINARKFAFISEEANLALKRSIICEGDILITIAGATVGKLAVVQKSHLPANTNQALAIVRPNEKKVYGMYLYYWLQADSISKNIDAIKTVGAQPNLSLAQVGDFLVNSPPLPEQQKIAKILTSVDEVIEKTQAQIDKLKDLKTGMMQELLTNGIGHTEFKDSPVGRIPADWERVKLGAVSSLITKGSTPTTNGHAYVNIGVRFFRSINASQDGTLLLNDIRFISEEASRAIRRSSLEQGDIVISIVGAKTGRTYFCIENSVHLPANINQNIALIRPINEVLSSAFLKFVISAQDFQHQVDLEVTTQAQPSLSLKQVGEFELNLPPITEQVIITEKLNSLVNGIKLIQDKLQQTKLLKKALMQDLLTGKVRVKVS